MTIRTLTILGMVVFAAMTRLLPHPPNFTAIGAMSLFGAATLSNRWLAVLVPLLALFLGDCILQWMIVTDRVPDWIAAREGFHWGMVSIYSIVFLITILGFTLRNRLKPMRIAGITLISSTLFFITTNFVVWITGGGYGYGFNISGFLECYTEALPFYRWTLMGDVCYSTLLFGSFVLLEYRFPSLVESRLIL